MNLNPSANNAPADSGVEEAKRVMGEDTKPPPSPGTALKQVKALYGVSGHLSSSGPSSDYLISDAWNQLSSQAREKAAYEMHGVYKPRQETREYVEGKVKELQQNLRLQMNTMRADEYLVQPFALAATQNFEFAFHPVTLERFLRKCDFNVSDAAEAVLRYFQWKLQIWGEGKLGKEIELDDLNDTDIEELKKGYFQILPERDRAGRQINVAIFNSNYPMSPCAVSVVKKQADVTSRASRLAHWPRSTCTPLGSNLLVHISAPR